MVGGRRESPAGEFDSPVIYTLFLLLSRNRHNIFILFTFLRLRTMRQKTNFIFIFSGPIVNGKMDAILLQNIFASCPFLNVNRRSVGNEKTVHAF
jgi:hypothetical protein